MRLRGFRIWILALLWALFFAGLLRVWNTPSGIHGERQVQTLGVSIAYYERLQREGWADPLGAFMTPVELPRTPTATVAYREFPLLPILGAPFFALGAKWGSFFACLIVFLLNWFAALYWAPKLWREWFGLRVAPAWLATACYFAIGAIEFHSAIFIPEGLAFPLLLGGAVTIRHRNALVNVVGAAMLFAAVTTQPVIGVAWIWLMVWPWMIRGREIWFKREIFFHQLLLAAALGASALVFERWHSMPIEPFDRLREVGAVTTFAWVVDQLWRGIFPIYTAWIWIPLAFSRAAGQLLVLVLMLVAVVAVEGSRVAGQGALFFGAGIGAFTLMGSVFSQPLRRSARVLAALSIVWGLIYGVRTHVWVSARPNWGWPQADLALPALKTRWNAATDFLVTDDVATHPIKLMTLGISGAVGTDRWSEVCTQPEFRRRNLYFVIDQATYFREINAGLFCLSTPGTETLAAPDGSGGWMVVRVPGWVGDQL